MEKTSDVGDQNLGGAVEDKGKYVEIFLNILSGEFDTLKLGSWRWASGRF